ncbi:MAG: hypothetical protein HWD61_07875 [Parachlamydiaceae bacterium]|nr:MAG: hypothetical protein HWD61_07875 [Parachlamydiaceae bacterium]
MDKLSNKFGHHCYSVIKSGPFVKRDDSKAHLRIALTIVKIVSYFTGFVPLILLIGKALHRARHSYKVLECNPLPAHLTDKYILRVRQLRADETWIPDLNECRKNVYLRETPAWQVIKSMPEIKELIDKFKLDFDQLPTEEKENPMNFLKLDPLEFFILDSLQSHMHQLDGGNFDQKQIFAKGFGVDAHGIEVQKGGIHNLLNIMLEGIIFSRWFGPLADGLPEFNAGPHGPYYIIIDSQKMKMDKRSSPRAQAGMIEEEYHKAYIVPEKDIAIF